MYVHIGKDVIINTSKIIAIFDINVLKKKIAINKLIENLNIGHDLIDVSEENRKSLILIKDDEKIKGYISNISSVTLAKRAQ